MDLGYPSSRQGIMSKDSVHMIGKEKGKNQRLAGHSPGHQSEHTGDRYDPPGITSRVQIHGLRRRECVMMGYIV